IYKRGKFYWYKFYFNGQLIRESTKQGNDKIARAIEAGHRTRLAKEMDQRNAKAEELGCSVHALFRCAECEKWFDRNHGFRASDDKLFCSDVCRLAWERKSRVIPTLTQFCAERVEPWAKATYGHAAPKTWLWYQFALKSLKEFQQLRNTKLSEIDANLIARFKADKHTKNWQASSINSSLRALRRVQWSIAANDSRSAISPTHAMANLGSMRRA